LDLQFVQYYCDNFAALSDSQQQDSDYPAFQFYACKVIEASLFEHQVNHSSRVKK